MRLILFDCDGTLVDSGALIVAAAEDAFVEFGEAPPDELTLRSAIGLSVAECMEFWRPQMGAEDRAAIGAAFGRHYWKYRANGVHAEPLFPGVLDLLDRLADEPDMLLGIVTGNSRRGLDAILAHHELAERFVTFQTACRHPSKPHPAMVLQALAETGADAASTVVIGDTAFDILMAKAAGALPVGVAWGNHPVERLFEAGAAHVAHHPDQLHPILGLT
ncbi:MAG TPA: HAD-IA family hydrolase [Geminicoccus sp.]|uniref:HAD-IA family hydrolase n=1 Tax=Geminicoccus sp. TaxID=2024832 RepID=UPI002E33D847|nr:HAD-IA family hydrolase [Geminicoccus sp.]HEX2526794.1 HAD-IA family hydrolase [Geminicoccus sp.]